MKYAVLILAALMIFSCKDNTSDPSDNNDYSIFYENSFDEPSDTAGWHGFFPDIFIDDTPPGVEGKSVRINGGCLQPAAELILSANKSGHYSISLWAKSDTSIEHSIYLTKREYADQQTDPHIIIKTKEWKFFEDQAIINLDSGETFRIQIISGGFIPSELLIDEFQIRHYDFLPD